MANENESPTEDLSRKRTIILVLYNVLITIIMSLLLYQTILKAAHAEANANCKQVVVTEIKVEKKLSVDDTGRTKVDSSKVVTKDTLEPANDSALVPAETQESKSQAPIIPDMIAYVLWAISLAGGLGAALSNLRGIFEISRDQTFFPAYLEMPFYVRPISGVICGLFTFFLGTFFAGALAAQGTGSGWQTVQGMFPYIGIAFVAGFASQEFMERLKETAKTLFGASQQADDSEAVIVQPVNANPTPEQNPGTVNSGGGEESFNPNAEEKAPETTPTQTPPAQQPMIVMQPRKKRRLD